MIVDEKFLIVAKEKNHFISTEDSFEDIDKAVKIFKSENVILN